MIPHPTARTRAPARTASALRPPAQTRKGRESRAVVKNFSMLLDSYQSWWVLSGIAKGMP